MLTYCSGCKKHTDNIWPKKLIIMTNKEIKEKSRCADCMANKSFSDKTKRKSELRLLCLIFQKTEPYETDHENLLCKV